MTFSRRVLVLFTLLCLILPTSATAARPDKAVYLTRTGECYHDSGCGYLHSSRIVTTLESAVSRGYRPCSRCHPGVLTGTVQEPSKSVVSEAVSAVTSYEDTNGLSWWALLYIPFIGVILYEFFGDPIRDWRKRRFRKRVIEYLQTPEAEDLRAQILREEPLSRLRTAYIQKWYLENYQNLPEDAPGEKPSTKSH